MTGVDILLVEDTAADAELTMRALERGGLASRLLWVKDGAQALDYLFASGAYASRPADLGPKVVLLDLRLPKVDGLEVLARVKGDGRTRTIPVVILTSSTEEIDLENCYRLGANSFISKPVEFEEFFRVVGELGLYWLSLNKIAEA